MWKLALLLLTGPLLYAAFGYGCQSSRYTVAGRDWCIPPHWVVFSDRNFAGRQDPSLDVDPPGGYVMIRVPQNVLMAEIPGFSEERKTGEPPLVLRQTVSAMIEPKIDYNGLRQNLEHDRKLFPELVPSLDESTGLWRLTTRRSESVWRWYFFPTSDVLAPMNRWVHWGSCTSRNVNDPEDYDCRRHLRHDGLSITYGISGVNLQHYEAIDRLLIDAIASWRCDQRSM